MNYHRDSDYRKFESTFRNIFQKRFNLTKEWIKKGKVLDIGCSNGIFLDLFKEKGFETWGVEPSENSDAAIKKGHRVIKDSFENAKFPEEYFDLIIMNHTLEHMENPEFVLKKANKLLKPKGILFADVPNAGGLGSRLLGKHWPLRLPLEHKWQFKRETISELFIKSGFEVLHWESRSGVFEFANPPLELKRRRFLIDLLLLPYSLFATLMNMGDSMSVIGRKK